MLAPVFVWVLVLTSTAWPPGQPPVQRRIVVDDIASQTACATLGQQITAAQSDLTYQCFQVEKAR